MFNRKSEILMTFFILGICFFSTGVYAQNNSNSWDGSNPQTQPTVSPMNPTGSSAVSSLPGTSFPSAALSPRSDTTARSKPSKEKTGYTLDLKELIRKSKEHIKAVNEKIREQEVRKRNQKREEKAREYFEKANQLFEEGKYQEARLEWEKAIKITENPEMDGYIRESPRVFRKKEVALKKEEDDRLHRVHLEDIDRRKEIEDSYQAGVSLYKQKKYAAAKEEFEHVQELQADHKATRSYLKIIDQDIIVEKDEAAKEKQKELEREQKEQEAAVQQEKEAWQKRLKEKERQREEETLQQAETTYKEAVVLYQAQDFVAAKAKFQEVEWGFPNYKATPKYLQQIDQDIKKKEQRIIAERQKELEKEKQEQELAKKKQAEEARLAKKQEEEDRKRHIEEQDRERLRKLTDQTEKVYQEALALFSESNFLGAKEKFAAVEKNIQNYRSTSDFLKRINDQIEGQQRQAAQERERKKKEEEIARQKQERELLQTLIDKAGGVYDQALSLYNVRNFKEAKEKFGEVSKILPNFKSTANYLSHIDDDIAREQERLALRKQKETERKKKEQELAQRQAQEEQARRRIEQSEALYRQAVSLYKAKNFEEAKGKFLELNKNSPNYQSTINYLAHIDEDISQYQEELARKKAQEEARQAKLAEERRQKEELAKKEAEEEKIHRAKLAEEHRQKEIERRQKEEALVRRKAEEEAHQAKLAEDRRQKELERQKEEALARKKAEEEKIRRAKLVEQRAQKEEFARQESEEDQARQAKLAQELSRKKAEAQAHRAKLDAEFRHKEITVKQKAAELAWKEAQEETQRQAQFQEQERLKQLNAQAEVLYLDGLNFYKAQNFEQAKEKFLEIQKINPAYKSTLSYLSHIDDNIQKEIERQKKAEELARRKAGEEARQANLEEERRQQEIKRKQKEEELAQKKAEEEKIRQAKRAEELSRKKAEEEARRAKRAEERRQKEIERKQKAEQLAWQKAREETQRQAQLEEQERRKEERVRQAKLEEDHRQEETPTQAVEEKQASIKAVQTPAPIIDQLALKEQKELERVSQSEKFQKKRQEEKKVKEERLSRQKQEAQQKKEETAQKKAQLQLIRQADQLYARSLKLYKAKKFAESKQVFHEFETLLVQNTFPEDYLKNMREKIRVEQVRIVEEQAKGKERLELKNKKQEELLQKQKEEQLAKSGQREEGPKDRQKQKEETQWAPAKQEQNEINSLPGKDLVAHQEKLKKEVEVLRQEQRQAKQEFLSAVEKLYQQAVDLYKVKKLDQSKVVFQEVIEMMPDYKKTKDYLRRIDEDTAQEKKRQLKAQEQKEKLLAEKQQKEQERIVEARELLLKGQQEKKELFKQRRIREQKRQCDEAKRKQDEEMRKRIKRTKELTAQLNIAEKHIAQKKPHSKSTSKRIKMKPARAVSDETKLDLIDQGYRQDDRMVQAEELYKEGLHLYYLRDYEKAQEQFRELESLVPNYKRARLYLQDIHERLIDLFSTKQNDKSPAAVGK